MGCGNCDVGLIKRIAHLEAEVKGYQQALAMQAEQGTNVFVVYWDGNVGVKVFGPDQDREQAFAETVAQWIALNWAVQDYLVSENEIKRLRSLVVQASAMFLAAGHQLRAEQLINALNVISPRRAHEPGTHSSDLPGAGSTEG